MKLLHCSSLEINMSLHNLAWFLVIILNFLFKLQFVSTCFPSANKIGRGTGMFKIEQGYSRCVANGMKECRKGAICLKGETKLPADDEFKTLDDCELYSADEICYTYGTDGNGRGSCQSDLLDCSWPKHKLIAHGFAEESQCEAYSVQAYVRCIAPDAGSGSRVCRPVDAGCSVGEVMSPSSANTRALFTVVSTLENCEAMEPRIICYDITVSPVSYNSGFRCAEDFKGCFNNEKRILTDILFANDGTCNGYIHTIWIRCVDDDNEARFSCRPYDPMTLSSCPSGETKLPSLLQFQSYEKCVNYAAWSLCYNPSNDALSCQEGPPAICAGFTVKSNFATFQECQAYRPSYVRCVRLAALGGTPGARRCVPYMSNLNNPSEIDEFCIAQFPEQNPQILYQDLIKCQEANIYTSCYSVDYDKFQCAIDFIGCSVIEGGGDWEALPPENHHTSLKACLSFTKLGYAEEDGLAPLNYARCVNQFTGVAKCRPSNFPNPSCDISGAIDKEYQQPPTTIFETMEECQNYEEFYYCYNTNHPTTRACVNDRQNCGDGQVALRKSTSQESVDIKLRTFNNATSCELFSPTWYKCGDVCRPTGGEFTTTGSDDSRRVSAIINCADGEAEINGFENLADCLAN